MNTQALAMNTRLHRARHAEGGRSPLRAMVAEGVGWAAYGLFYLTTMTTLLGLPIGLAYYLVGFQN